jgi:hypothetical protein
VTVRYAGLALLCLLACHGAPRSALRMEAPAFAEGAPIPKAFTADGGDRSPELVWSGAPAGTAAFALLVEDPDASGDGWVHWLAYDLPASARGLAEGQARTAELPGGGRQGRNSWGRLGWNGPDPPPGSPHHYVFHLYALSAPTGLGPGADRAALERAMKGRLLGEARRTGIYGR